LLSEKFFDAISRFLPVPSKKLQETISNFNPDRIYLENVRSALGISTNQARRICETAVRQGLFRQGVEVLCPDGSVAASAADESHLPQTVHCWVEESGHVQELNMNTSELKKAVFYSLNG
jgi:hypothetical protein